MEKRVLVIGGAGYIGGHVLLSLLENDFSPVVYDNLSSGDLENIPSGVEFVKGDILDYDALLSVMDKDNGFDAIIHLAALKAAGKSMEEPEKYSRNNIVGTINILNAALEKGIKNVLFSSTAALYGTPKYLPIDENHPTNPENYYGFTKLNIENILEWYGKLKGMKYAILRYFNAAGYDVKGRVSGLERNPENLLPIIMEVASGKREKLSLYGNDYDTRDGTCVRDYVHVNDLAQGHVLALKYLFEKEKSLLVNLGSEQGITVKELVDKAREITGKEIPCEVVARRAGDCSTVVASSKKAKEVLGWEAKNSDVDNLIKSTWEVYNKKLG